MSITVEDGDYELVGKTSIIGEDEDIIVTDYGIKMDNLYLSQCFSDATTNLRQGPGIKVKGLEIAGHFHFFDLKSYIQDIWASFQANEKNLLKQLEIDFPRQVCFINDIKCLSMEDFINFINLHLASQGTYKPPYSSSQNFNTRASPSLFYINTAWIKNKNGKMERNIFANPDLLAFMLCTQASFAYIFDFFHKIFISDAKNLTIKRIFSTPEKKHITIHKDENLTFELLFDFDVWNYETDTRLKRVFSRLFIRFNDFLTVKDKEPQGVLIWKQEG